MSKGKRLKAVVSQIHYLVKNRTNKVRQEINLHCKEQADSNQYFNM